MTEREAAALFKTLSDETRVKIVRMLADDAASDETVQREGLCACGLLEELAISQPTLSYHMKNLMDSGLVLGVKDGVWMRYSLNPARVAEASAFFEALSMNARIGGRA